jgi:predicted nucleic acid-binding protein
MNDFDAEPFGRPRGVAAVLDTSVLVRAWLSSVAKPNPSRRVMMLVGAAYDSFTSPAILDEVEDVLIRPRFGASVRQIRLWLDVFVRASRQVFPELIPGDDARAVRGDIEDLPILETAYAVPAAGEELGDLLVAAQTAGGWSIVSEDTHHFTPGRNVYGWRFITAHTFLGLLRGRGRTAG